jgi:hypothetical protein
MIRHLTQKLHAIFILLFSIRIKISKLKLVNLSSDARTLRTSQPAFTYLYFLRQLSEKVYVNITL